MPRKKEAPATPLQSEKDAGIRPILRWAGGKRWLTPTLRTLVPRSYGTYFEPFLGGASLFFATLPAEAVLSDVNAHLMFTYRAIRDIPTAIAKHLSAWPNDKQTYYTVRATHFRDRARAAARFIYLNRTCWNGLYRVSKRGTFNVPYGATQGRRPLEPRHLMEASRALRGAQLLEVDFEVALATVKSTDFVFLDPPYTALHNSNGFRRYNEILFSWNDQLRLAKVACELSAAGCYVAVTNINHPEVQQLYRDFTPIILRRQSRIAGDARHRTFTDELLLLSPTLERGNINEH